MLFTINGYVKIKLTDEGKIFLSRNNWHYLLSRIDEDGWLELQLWEVMSFFGDKTYMGGPLLFETNIEILV
jgi:hypothetical protein